MPETKNGTPEDYEEYKRQQNLELPVRDVDSSGETEAQRTHRHMNYASEGETPDQRTNRYLDKARRAGYTSGTPMAPQGAPTGSSITSWLDKYRGNDEEDNRIRQGVYDTLHPDAAMGVADKVSDYGKQHLSEKFRASLRDLAERYSDRVNPAVGNARRDNEIAENARSIEIAKKYVELAKNPPPPRDGGEIDEPPGRQPVMQERGFSNEEDKAIYLEKVRQAVAAAKK